MKKPCLVCKKKESKYKCPTCFLPFCSVPCNKKHKSTPCAPAPREAKSTIHVVDIGTAKRQEDEEMLPGDRILLTEKQLEGIDSHIEVQHKLRDERVLRMLQRIDSAPNRVKALEKEMKDPAFLEFCDDVLEAVGCRSQENEDLSIEERLLALLQQ